MLSFEQIEALEAFDASDARVLSAYLTLWRSLTSVTLAC